MPRASAMARRREWLISGRGRDRPGRADQGYAAALWLSSDMGTMLRQPCYCAYYVAFVSSMMRLAAMVRGREAMRAIGAA